MDTFFGINEVITLENVDLRGTITDTLGTIAGAVGKDKFSPYMDHSFNLAVQGMKSESSRLRESAFCFFAVLASVLKDDLNPALPEILPSILETLKQEDVDFGDKISEEQAQALLNGNGAETELLDTDDDDESIELNVNSALQLEKEIAADALGEIFTNTRQAFLPYLKDSVEQLLELSDTFYDGGRKSALSALWKFVTTLGEIQCEKPWQPGLPLVYHFSLNANRRKSRYLLMSST
jgi:importin-4